MLFLFENIAVYNLVIKVILVTTDTLNVITDKSFFYVNKVEKIKSAKNYFVILLFRERNLNTRLIPNRKKNVF